MSDTPRLFTPEEAKLLAEIFRIVCKEIKTKSDVDALAPGELGINYTEGCFYIRNPYTGELFCPNSVENAKIILSKFNPRTHDLNADTVGYIKFYTSLDQLPQIGMAFTADTAIRQMTTPSILMADVEHENYAQLGYPSKKGMLVVHKLSEAITDATFRDFDTNTLWDGIYNAETHKLEGWMKRSGSDWFAYTVAGGDSAYANINKEPEELSVVYLRVLHEVNPGANLTIGGQSMNADKPIVYADGSPLDETLKANNTIALINTNDAWIYCKNSDPQHVINKIIAGRISGS